MNLHDYIRPTSADENIYTHIDKDNANKEKQKELLYGKSSKEKNTLLLHTMGSISQQKHHISQSCTPNIR